MILDGKVFSFLYHFFRMYSICFMLIFWSEFVSTHSVFFGSSWSIHYPGFNLHLRFFFHQPTPSTHILDVGVLIMLNCCSAITITLAIMMNKLVKHG